ncbi:hypothetical protein Bpfe_025931, partial [Biomphalaria pfeifferi]
STKKFSDDVEGLQQYNPLTELTQQSTRYISRFNSSCVLTPSHVVFVAGLLAAILLCHCCKRISVLNT